MTTAGSHPRRWQFWIDRGGTFTDCLGVDPADGRIKSAKVLSSDRAPLIGIRKLLGSKCSPVVERSHEPQTTVRGAACAA